MPSTIYIVSSAARISHSVLPVALVESTGSTSYLTTATTPEMVVVINGRIPVRNGETIGLDFEQEHLHLFDADTGMRIE